MLMVYFNTFLLQHFIRTFTDTNGKARALFVFVNEANNKVCLDAYSELKN